MSVRGGRLRIVASTSQSVSMDPAGGLAGWHPEVGHCFFAVQVARLSPTPSVSASRQGVDFPRLDPGRERHAADALLDLAGVEHAPRDEVLTREDAIVRDEQIPTKRHVRRPGPAR